VTEDTTFTITKNMSKFWEAGIELRRQTWNEFANRQDDYGDVWLDLAIDDLCGQIRAEANRIRPEMDREKLKHRVLDANAYLTMLFRLLDEQ